jgi:hypothetical protein
VLSSPESKTIENEINAWEIVQNENATKEKTYALSQLMQSYNSPLQTLTNGPESYMNRLGGRWLATFHHIMD